VTASLRYLRKLVLGETWSLPLGILAAVLALAALRAWSQPAGWFASAGGFVLLALLILALSASLKGGGRRPPP
jgi:hypothetical protein